MNYATPQIPESQLKENNLVWEFFGRKTSGFFVEVGANDPFLLSQTWMLEQKGWTGVLVEPLAACCADLRRYRVATGWTIEDVPRRLECSPAMISRIETSLVKLGISDLRAVLDI